MPHNAPDVLAVERGRSDVPTRLDSWAAHHETYFWSMDFKLAEHGGFDGSVSALAVGAVGIARVHSSLFSGTRTRSHIARDSRDNYSLAINSGDTPIFATHIDRESRIEPGAAMLISGAEPFSFSGPNEKLLVSVAVPQQLLSTAARHVESRLGLRVEPGAEALQLLRRYCALIQSSAPLRTEALQTHAANTLLDLLALATGTVGEAAELPQVRGLRAGRLASVLERIRAGYAQPGISAESVGRELGLSARYIQDLLAETGTGFAERVLELRLQMTRTLLTDRTNDNLRISEIAYASGFSDISYFNRCFRRRFGCTPGSLR